MPSYNNNLIGTLGVDNESSYPNQLGITIGVDTLDMCTITFGTSYSIRIPAKDVDALRDMLHTASQKIFFDSVARHEKENGPTYTHG